MTVFSLEIMAEKIGAKLLQNNSSVGIEYVLTDSRTATFSPTTCFFAIVSLRNNGHKYVKDLYEKGVRNFVISEELDLELVPEASLIRVENTIDALQQFASEKRKQFKGKVVAITGSNGKTIVKEWLYQVLRKQYFVSRSPKSYNSQIGVALSLWNMDALADIVLVEAGISELGEMEKLEEMIFPDAVIITNLGPAHQQNFNSLQQKVEEKIKLTKRAKQVYYCKDHKEIDTELKNTVSSTKLFSWSFNAKQAINATVNAFPHYSEISLVDEKERIQFTIPFTDSASIENAIQVCFFAKSLKMPIPLLIESLAKLEPVEMRLHMKNGINGCKIINDTYNSDVLSLSIALDFLAQQSISQHLKRTLILSDIQESGKSKKELYTEVERLIISKNIQRLIGIGKDISMFLQTIPVDAQFYPNTQDFVKSNKKNDFYSEVILLKGAREFQFEQLSKMLEMRMNRTILEINMNALLHNFHYYKSLLQPSTKIMGMVKAFAYGSGSLEVARLLQYHGCNYLAVAVVDEGVELRNGGIDLPILVLAPERESFQKLIEYKLQPEIYSFSILNDFVNELKQQGLKNYPIHLKFDTGMHRFGFMQSDVDELLQIILQSAEVKIQSVFTHLAASDDSAMDDFTQSQFSSFNEIAEKLKHSIKYPFLQHVLNSVGTERFPDMQLNMVRLGIGLYGINTANPLALRHVVTFKTNIAQVRKVPENQSVGYSRLGWTNKESRIATIPVGYADGLDRRLSNGVGEVWVNCKKAPIIGNVCMDLAMVDVSDMDVEEGDEVILMGDEISVEEWAEKLNTIPYEVLTNISQRVKRVYLTE